jgi:hypothetical protein
VKRTSSFFVSNVAIVSISSWLNSKSKILKFSMILSSSSLRRFAPCASAFPLTCSFVLSQGAPYYGRPDRCSPRCPAPAPAPAPGPMESYGGPYSRASAYPVSGMAGTGNGRVPERTPCNSAMVWICRRAWSASWINRVASSYPRKVCIEVPLHGHLGESHAMVGKIVNDLLEASPIFVQFLSFCAVFTLQSLHRGLHPTIMAHLRFASCRFVSDKRYAVTFRLFSSVMFLFLRYLIYMAPPPKRTCNESHVVKFRVKRIFERGKGL